MRIRLARKIVKNRSRYSNGKFIAACVRLGYVIRRWRYTFAMPVRRQTMTIIDEYAEIPSP